MLNGHRWSLSCQRAGFILSGSPCSGSLGMAAQLKSYLILSHQADVQYTKIHNEPHFLSTNDSRNLLSGFWAQESKTTQIGSMTLWSKMLLMRWSWTFMMCRTSRASWPRVFSTVVVSSKPNRVKHTHRMKTHRKWRKWLTWHPSAIYAYKSVFTHIYTYRRHAY